MSMATINAYLQKRIGMHSIDLTARINVKMQIHGETSIVCNEKDLTRGTTFNNSPVGRTNLPDQKSLSTGKIRYHLDDKTQQQIDGLKNSCTKNLNSKFGKRAKEKTSKLTGDENNPLKNTVFAKTPALNSIFVKKTREISILPRELSFEDFHKYTNIESCIRNDILKKFPTKSEVYLVLIEKYIKKYYFSGFIHKRRWPRNLKFKDPSIYTMDDLKRIKKNEKAHSKLSSCIPFDSMEIHKGNTKENDIKQSTDVSTACDENKHNTKKKVAKGSPSKEKANGMGSNNRQKFIDHLAVNSRNDSASVNTITNSPRSKMIIEHIEHFDNDHSESLRNIAILPCQISYDDFRNFTNIESCVHEDILRKDPANSQLHFTRVATYIKKYYELYFSKRKKWPSRIKFLDKTIKTMDDLNRKKGRMRNEGAGRETVTERQEEKSDASEPVFKSPNLIRTNDSKRTLNAQLEDADLLQMKKNLMSPTRSCTKNRWRTACTNMPYTVNTIIHDFTSNSKASRNKSNSSKDVESLFSNTESTSTACSSSMESLRTDITSPHNCFNRKRKRKSNEVGDQPAKMLRIKNPDETNEDIKLESDGESFCSSEDSIMTTIFPFSRSMLDTQHNFGNISLPDNVHDQYIKEEANNNVTNEELDVLRNLCKSLESEFNNDAEHPNADIKSEWQEENALEMRLTHSYLKRLSKLVSKSQQSQRSNDRTYSSVAPIQSTDSKPEIFDNCSERTESIFSSNSSDLKVIENDINEVISIRDHEGSVNDLLEQMMNIIDPNEISQNGFPRDRVHVSPIIESGNKENGSHNTVSGYSDQSQPINPKQLESSDDIELDQFFEELSKIIESSQDKHKEIQRSNYVSCARLLSVEYIKSLKSTHNFSNNQDNILRKYLMEKGSREIKSNSDISATPEKNIMELSVEHSASDSKYEMSDYISDTTVASESSVIIPYQSEKITHLPKKTRKRKNSGYDKSTKNKKRKLTLSNSKIQVVPSKQSVDVRKKSTKSNMTNQMHRNTQRKYLKNTRSAERSQKSLKYEKRNLRSNILSSKHTNYDRRRDSVQVLNVETQQKLSAADTDDSGSDQETDTSVLSQINQPLTCYYLWITNLHMQRLPRSAMLSTSYTSSVPLMNAVSNVPLKPKITLWRHKFLIVKILDDKVRFHLKVDATDEDRMYNFLEISLNGSNKYSSNDRVSLRFLQTVFDNFAPIHLEKQNIIIHDAAS